VSAALPGSGLPDAFVVPGALNGQPANPYLVQLTGDPNAGPLDIYKRETQFGARQYNQVDNTFQINGGFKGEIGGGWNYDVFFQYGEDDEQVTNTGNINFLHLENELGFQQVQATPAQIAAITASNGGFDPLTFGIYNPNVCVATAGCSLANPFGQNLTPQQIAYAKYTEAQQSRYTLKVYGGSVTNNELFQLPAGGVGLSLGVEHRTETGEFTPDSLDLTGEGLGSTAQPTKGGFDVTELYGETRIPILKDVFLAKDLHIDVGGRFFNYNTFGSGETWKVAGNYTPVTGIRFRGSDGVAFRQPSVNDLYTGDAISFIDAFDPCAQVASYGAKAGIVAANCAKSGVNPATFVQAGTQIQTIVGGNPLLSPETARTQTAGVVLNPPFIPRLDVTVDYSRTKIDNFISSLPTQFIVDQCYTSTTFTPGSGTCAAVSPRAGTGQLNTVSAINENLGVLKTEAIDFGLTYAYPLAGNLGTLSFQNDLTLTLKYQAQSVPNGPFIGYLNTIGITASAPSYPRYRDNANFNWRWNNFQFGYTMRFIEGTIFDQYPGPLVQGKDGSKGQVASSATPDVYYHDINLSYDYSNFTVNAGVQNLFDKQPPFVPDGATNTDPAVYDVYGRVVYLKTTLRF
jgi:outer membrane receptor protein involved in Fe transport